ncbi:hypothetical protein Dimus_025315 [Dionaea muscipula]
MEGRGEKVRERKNVGGQKVKQEEEFMGMNLRRGILVGKSGGRGGPSTPPPIWAFEVTDNHHHHHHRLSSLSTTINKKVATTSSSSSVSARQLGAAVWEVFTMSNGGSGLLCRRHYPVRNKGLKIETVFEDPLESETPTEEQPQSTSSFHRQIAETRMQHHRPVSPASYSSSMEVTPFNASTTSSLDLNTNAKIGDSRYSVKTSTELLKILNRIWSLEEQHRSNISLVKALRKELDYARVRIKDLVKEKQMDKQVIDNLMKKFAEDKVFRKKRTEQERMESAVQLARNEAEDERKLRKRSESLHRKLGREVNELKSCFNRAVNELQRERKSRVLLEDLCDEFAICIRDYEKDLRSLNYKSEKGHFTEDNLILHMSEAWLDERAQMKSSDGEKKKTTVEELGSEIETFLKARKGKMAKERRSSVRRHSLESFPFNEAGSAPKIADDEDEDDNDHSIDSFSNCFELNKTVDDAIEESKPQERAANKDTTRDEVVRHGQSRRLSSLQARFLQHISRSACNVPENNKSVEPDVEDDDDEGVEGSRAWKGKQFGNSSGQKVHPENNNRVDGSHHRRFSLGGPVSPVKKWESPDRETFESETKLAKGSRDHTLKARLLEARLEGKQKQSHSHSNIAS